LVQRLEVLNQLLKSRSGPINVLDALGQSIPENAWLDEVSLSFGEKMNLSFSGGATTSESVTRFGEKLTASIHLSSVQLNEMTSAVDGKEEIRKFSFVAKPKIN